MRKIILSILFILLFVSSASAVETWWNLSFVNRTDYRLNSGSVPYQLNVSVHNGAGANTATDLYIYCGTTNCADIRPVLNNATFLNHSWTISPVTGAGTIGNLWVNLTTSAAGDILNFYSGNSTATTLRNNLSTFDMYDDFEDTDYTNNPTWTSGGGYSVASELLSGATSFRLKGVTQSSQIYTIPSRITNKQWEWDYYISGKDGANNALQQGLMYVLYTDANNFVQAGSSSGYTFQVKEGGVLRCNYDSGSNTVTAAVHRYKITRIGNNWEFFVDGTSKTTCAYGYTTAATSTRYQTGASGGDAVSNPNRIDNYVSIDIPAAHPTVSSAGSTFTYTLPVPVITSPANGTWWNSTFFTNLTWTVPTCAYCDTSTFHYQTWISTLSNFGDIVNETNYTHPQMTDYLNVSGADGIRYVRVRTNDSRVDGAWSISRYYYVNSTGGLNLVSPLNGSTQSANTVILQWVDSNQNAPYTYQLSTDSGFLNIISSGTGTNSSLLYSTSTINLQYDTQYWWHVKNASSAYTTAWNFTILPFTAVPGRLNITALDEVNFTLVTAFTVSLYNSSGAYLAKSTTNGWVNFTGSEVIEGDYLAIATGNSSYAERTLLMTSPGNYTFYLPSVSNTIDTVAFYLLDYTMKFPYLESNMTITRGSNITQSAGFDADAKQAANLIRGASYTITVANNNSGMIQQWGNYISTGSGNVQVVIMNLGVNQSVLNPYTQHINSSNVSIEMSWNDTASFLNSVNMTVYKDNTSTPVYNLVTSVKTGTATYLITDSNAVYITQMIANTTLGTHSDTNVLDLTSNTATITLWSYGGFTMPAWVKNAFGIVALFMLAGSFGAMHRGEGAIITGIMAIFFYWWKILTQDSMIASMLGALLLFAVLYHLSSKAKPGGIF